MCMQKWRIFQGFSWRRPDTWALVISVILSLAAVAFFWWWLVNKSSLRFAVMRQGVAQVESQSADYQVNPDFDAKAYQAAIGKAWEEMLDKGYATKSVDDDRLLVVQYPSSPTSQELVTATIDTRQPTKITLVSDGTSGFGNDKVKVFLDVTPERALEIKIYQSVEYGDPSIATALSIAFDTMALKNQPYTGPVPVIQAFEEEIRPHNLNTLERL